MKNGLTCLTAIFWLVFSPSVLSQTGDHVAIVGGTIHTVTDQGVIKGGTVLIKGDRIVSVGADVRIPNGAKIIQANGKVVVPGFMNGRTQIALFETPEPVQAADSRGESVLNAAFDVRYGLNPQSVVVAENRRHGLTHAVVAPTSTVNRMNPGASMAGVDDMFYGRGALISLNGRNDMLIQSGPQFVSLADSGHRNIGWGQLRVIFDQVSRYSKNRDKVLNGKWSGDFLLTPFNMDALIPVLEGETTLAIMMDSASDIRQAIAFKQAYKIDVLIIGAAEGWKVADELATAEIPVLINPTDNLPLEFLSIGATLKNASLLQDAGVLFSFVASPFISAHRASSVSQGAGIAVAHGLEWSEALKALTINAAEIFGIDEDYGSIEPGKVANIVIWDTDPLEVYSSVEHVIINGQDIPVSARQSMLTRKYQALHAQ